MNCRDTERLWNELLDARGLPRPAIEAAIAAHAASCPACARLGARYRTLDLAITAQASSPVAAASPDFLERLRLARIDEPEVPAVLPLHRLRLPGRPAWLATAAAIVIVGLIGGRTGWFAGREAIRPEPTFPRRSITSALVDVTSATLELARETSAPAGRVGRLVLASAELTTAEPPPPFEVPIVPTSAVLQLQSVGDRVEAGVVPLSDSARQAFGFLLRTPAGIAPADAPHRGS
jgi:anti-sigma factor RsiW